MRRSERQRRPGMFTKTRSRRTNIVTAYVLAVVILFFGRQLASNLRAPASQSVANALIFISDSDSIDARRGSNSVFRIGLDGRGLKRIVGSIPHGEGYLRISDIDCHAASQQLVIASHRYDLNGFHHALLDGSGLHFDKPGAGDLLSGTRQISIAPDGKRIIVSRQFKEFEEPRFGLVAGDLMSREFKTVKTPTAKRSYLSPDFGPDERQIAYIIERLNSDKTKRYQIVTAQPSGADEQIVYETAERISDVAWSPDGEWLALEMNRQIYKLRPYGSDLTRLTNHSSGASHPRWSPDSQRISFVAPSSFRGFNQLLVMDADGRNIQQVASVRGEVVNGCWV